MKGTKSIVSKGELADRLRISLRAIDQIVSRLRIAPAFEINGIPYLDERDCQRIADHLDTSSPTPRTQR